MSIHSLALLNGPVQHVAYQDAPGKAPLSISPTFDCHWRVEPMTQKRHHTDPTNYGPPHLVPTNGTCTHHSLAAPSPGLQYSSCVAWAPGIDDHAATVWGGRFDHIHCHFHWTMCYTYVPPLPFRRLCNT